MPFKRAGWLQPRNALAADSKRTAVSMPFKRAGWLQRVSLSQLAERRVSMPFKRAGWLQLNGWPPRVA